MLDFDGNVNAAVDNVERRYEEELIFFVLLLEFNVLVNILFEWLKRECLDWMDGWLAYGLLISFFIKVTIKGGNLYFLSL